MSSQALPPEGGSGPVTFNLEYFLEKLVADLAARGRGLATEQDLELVAAPCSQETHMWLWTAGRQAGRQEAQRSPGQAAPAE